MKIIQVSDIHIGGDYDGQFKVKKNFEDVINKIPKSIDLLVISGDIADKDYEENYNYVKNFLENNIKCPIVYLCGNHDDGEAMSKVFDNCVVGKNPFVMSGSNSIITFIDTSKGVLSKETARLIPNNSIIFTHYPLVSVPHKFMNKFSLKNLEEARELLIKKKVKDVFCGHFHYAYDGHSEVNIHITPATQCQIDAREKEFKVGSYKPGYRFIEIENEIVKNTTIHYL